MPNRYAYFVLENKKAKNGEYLALCAREHVKGYYKMVWTWGKDFDKAEKIAEKWNDKRGIDQDQASKIVASTMRN